MGGNKKEGYLPAYPLARIAPLMGITPLMGTTPTSISAKHGLWYLSPLLEPIRLWGDGAGAVAASTDIEEVRRNLNFDP